MRFIASFYFPLLLCLVSIGLLLVLLFHHPNEPKPPSYRHPFDENAYWSAPDEMIGSDSAGELVRYGQELVVNTATYLGPGGVIRHSTNGMNCGNCHLQGGTQNFANPFSAVAATYPRYRPRSGRTESVEYRVNDCLQRSLNGRPIDSLSTEMRAFVAYIKWVGRNVPAKLRPKGSGVEALPLLDRAADPKRGAAVFSQHCQRCHGAKGEGLPAADGFGFRYPPLWGNKSFAASAGILRLSSLAGYIRNNMPFGTNWTAPQLRVDEAWDVAAFIASQPRPAHPFPADWPRLADKPFDFPFGPYADSFPEEQHRYGPFGPIKKKADVAARLSRKGE